MNYLQTELFTDKDDVVIDELELSFKAGYKGLKRIGFEHETILQLMRRDSGGQILRDNWNNCDSVNYWKKFNNFCESFRR